jgi:GntR family transcriptional regulator, transcriptional repressor for pyruvate dehydrogenase complex
VSRGLGSTAKGTQSSKLDAVRSCFPQVPIDELLGERSASRELKLSESVAREIVAEISGLAVGSALPSEAAMMAHFRVGRPTLREALRIIEVEGIISLKRGQGGGPIVKDHSVVDVARMLSLHFQAAAVTLNDLLSARAMFEPAAAGLAAQARTEKDLDNLRALLDRHFDTGFGSDEQRSVSTYYRPWQEFHMAVAAISGNPVTELLVGAIQALSMALGNPFPAQSQGVVHDDHAAIFRAIEAQDSELASRRMHQHLVELTTAGYAGVDDAILTRPIEWQ